MTNNELIKQLLQQNEALSATIAAQPQLIAQLNQTIRELKEQLNKNSKNSSKPPSSDGYKKPAPKSLRKPSDKKVGEQDGHQGIHLAVITAPDEIIKHMPSACEGCQHYQICKGTACIAEKRHVIDAVVAVNVTEHQALELPICILYGDTRRGDSPSNVKAAVQYGENLQALAVALNTVGAVSIKRSHEILSGVFNIPIATGTISSMVKRCADSLSETVGKIKDKMIGSALRYFDETGTRVDKNSGGFMMPQTVNIPILISVPNVELQAWNNAVFSRNSKGLLCMTAGLPTGVIRIFSMQSAVPIFSVN